MNNLIFKEFSFTQDTLTVFFVYTEYLRPFNMVNGQECQTPRDAGRAIFTSSAFWHV